MEPKEIKENLKKVIYTLNTVEIHGKQNMDRMLGCIQLLEYITDGMEEACSKDIPAVESSWLEESVERNNAGE